MCIRDRAHCEGDAIDAHGAGMQADQRSGGTGNKQKMGKKREHILAKVGQVDRELFPLGQVDRELFVVGQRCSWLANLGQACSLRKKDLFAYCEK